jgi:hypothetical protein
MGRSDSAREADRGFAFGNSTTVGRTRRSNPDSVHRHRLLPPTTVRPYRSSSPLPRSRYGPLRPMHAISLVLGVLHHCPRQAMCPMLGVFVGCDGQEPRSIRTGLPDSRRQHACCRRNMTDDYEDEPGPTAYPRRPSAWLDVLRRYSGGHNRRYAHPCIRNVHHPGSLPQPSAFAAKNLSVSVDSLSGHAPDLPSGADRHEKGASQMRRSFLVQTGLTTTTVTVTSRTYPHAAGARPAHAAKVIGALTQGAFSRHVQHSCKKHLPGSASLRMTAFDRI